MATPTSDSVMTSTYITMKSCVSIAGMLIQCRFRSRSTMLPPNMPTKPGTNM